MSKVIIRSPKRDTIRILEYVSVGFNTAQQNFTIFTASEKVTLYRAILRGNMQAGTARARMVLALHKSTAPPDIPLLAALATGSNPVYTNSGSLPMNILSQGADFKADVGDIVVNIDSKAMRKLAPGQSIVLSTISGAINAGVFGGTLLLFFKE